MKNATAKNFEFLNANFGSTEEILENIEKQQKNSFELLKKTVKDSLGDNGDSFVSYLDKQNKTVNDFNTDVKNQVKGAVTTTNPLADVTKFFETVSEFNKGLYLNNVAFMNDSLQKFQVK